MSSKKFNYNSPHIDIFQKLTLDVLDIRVQSFTYFFDDDKSFKTEDSNRICFMMEPFFEIIALT